MATLLCGVPLPAQTPSPLPPTPVHALFLSDIHFDPFADPAKVPQLNAAPAAAWAAILAAPPAPTPPIPQADLPGLEAACPVRGFDTSAALWQSSLSAIRASASHPSFVTVSGDLLAHQFDCKYRTLLPAATHADYLAFTVKTLQYVVLALQASVSKGVPIYLALGNNDSACTDYALNPTHDEFLAAAAQTVAGALPADLSPADRDAVLRDFAAGGYYSAPLATVPHTRILVLDDTFLSTKYTTCSGRPDPAPAAAQLAWLEVQLAAARQRGERVWVMGHIPPGVDLYGSARKLFTLCAGSQPQMFLGSERLAEVLAANAGIVRLALFGHTHSDEIRLLPHEGSSRPEAAQRDAAVERPAVVASSVPRTQPTTNNRQPATIPSAVPLKIVPSISPVNGNRPSFTLASIDPATATLVDYTVIEASNLTGIAATWSPEYTYSTAYHQPAFDAASLSSLFAAFQADPAAKTPASQAYLRNYFPGDMSAVIQFAWPQYTCTFNHDSAQAFTACVCAAKNGDPK